MYALCLISLMGPTATAGNKDRAGQSGAGELQMQSWGRLSGLHGMATSNITGLEAMSLNPGGLAFTKKLDIAFANTQWLKGSGVNISGLGLAAKLGGEDGKNVLGLTIQSVRFGDIPVTLVSDPDAELGASFSPQLLNIGLCYARSFSNSIHVGFGLKLLNESIANVSASGVAMDMGIQYVTGPQDNIHFGISLRNVGTGLQFGGDGLTYQAQANNSNLIFNLRTESFELPTQLNIGAGYDIKMAEQHRLSIMGNFSSNAFSSDQLGGGLEYAFKNILVLRGGYKYETGGMGDFSTESRMTVYTGLSAGLSLNLPLKTDGPSIGVDYGYRHTDPYSGSHTIGVRIEI